MFEVLSGCNVIGHGIFGSMARNYEPPQPPNYDNVEMEGIGSLTLPNSLKAPFEKFELSGNSAQGENPSIESPKEIKNSGKYDEVSGKYVIDVSVTGKNLLPKEIVLVNNDGNNGVKTIKYDKESHQYILQMKENNTNQVIFMFYLHLKKGIYTIRRNIIVDGVLTNKKEIVVKNANTNVSLVNKYSNCYSTFEVPEDMKVLINAGDYTGKKNKDAIIYDFQLEMGDKVTDYEPYKEPQTTQIALDEPLRGIGEYKDVITKDGILRKIKEIVLDENTGFTNHLGGMQNKTICFATHILKDATNISALNNAMSDKIEKVTYVDGQDKECFTLFNKRIYIKLSRERNIDTVEKLKEWLKQNPIKIQYLLQEPVLETFENRLDSLHTNDGTTIITVDSGEVETGIECTYRKGK